MTWLPRPLRGESDASMSIALGVALLLAIQPDAGANRLAVIGGLFLTFLLTRWLRLGWWGILVLLVAGIALRVGASNREGSDVLDVTADAVRQALLGLNPWGHGFESSRPPGASLPYGPLELLWYAPGVGNPREIELFVSCAVLALFAVRGRPVALAVYATAPTVILTATDGSNDTSAGLLILAALVVAAARPWLGAVLLAAAVAFKPYAGAWLPALLAYGGFPALIGFVAASVVMWAPAAYLWGIDQYLVSLRMADEAHRTTYWSVGVLWEQITGHIAPHELLDRARLIVAGGITVAGLLFARSIDRVIVIGSVIFIVMMFGGFWGSYAYLGAIAPILCWKLDDWLRVPVPDHVRSLPWAPAIGAVEASEPEPKPEHEASPRRRRLGRSEPVPELAPEPVLTSRRDPGGAP